jgi:hypothetical protein
MEEGWRRVEGELGEIEKQNRKQRRQERVVLSVILTFMNSILAGSLFFETTESLAPCQTYFAGHEWLS